MSNYISQLLGNLLLAGMTSLSSGQSTNFDNSELKYASGLRNEEPSRKSRSSYAQQVDAWFSDLQKTHGSYLPKGMRDLRTLNVSDDALEILAFSVYNNVKAAQEVKPHEDDHFNITQYKLADGSYLWKDHVSGKELRATRIGHGRSSHYDFAGSNIMKFALGGRGELGTIMKMLDDDDPNHDYPTQQKAI